MDTYATINGGPKVSLRATPEGASRGLMSSPLIGYAAGKVWGVPMAAGGKDADRIIALYATANRMFSVSLVGFVTRRGLPRVGHRGVIKEITLGKTKG